MWWNEECAEAPRSLLRRADRFCSFRSSFAGPCAASNGSMWAFTRPSGPSTTVVRFAVGLASERRASKAVIIASASLIRG